MVIPSSARPFTTCITCTPKKNQIFFPTTPRQGAPRTVKSRDTRCSAAQRHVQRGARAGTPAQATLALDCRRPVATFPLAACRR